MSMSTIRMSTNPKREIGVISRCRTDSIAPKHGTTGYLGRRLGGNLYPKSFIRGSSHCGLRSRFNLSVVTRHSDPSQKLRSWPYHSQLWLLVAQATVVAEQTQSPQSMLPPDTWAADWGATFTQRALSEAVVASGFGVTWGLVLLRVMGVFLKMNNDETCCNNYHSRLFRP